VSNDFAPFLSRGIKATDGSKTSSVSGQFYYQQQEGNHSTGPGKVHQRPGSFSDVFSPDVSTLAPLFSNLHPSLSRFLGALSRPPELTTVGRLYPTTPAAVNTTLAPPPSERQAWFEDGDELSPLLLAIATLAALLLLLAVSLSILFRRR